VTTIDSQPAAVAALFDEPSQWRADIISEFRLRGAERCAAASPTPGFPQLLDSVVRVAREAPTGVWLDVGGGLGGTASWLERTIGQRVVVVDSSIGSLRGARQLFPSLDVTSADAGRLPVRDASVEVVIMSGVLSLLGDVAPLFAELDRVVSPAGRIVVTDLWSSTSLTERAEPNTFWSIEDIEAAAEEAGFRPLHSAIADLATGWWSSAAIQVHDEIHCRHSGAAAYPAWRRDLEHLDQVIADGAVIPCGIVLGR
jgi:SAM-dependent methyltransferase